MTKKAVKGLDGGIEVVVDNVASRENVTRFLEATGFTVERIEEGKGWLLKASRS